MVRVSGRVVSLVLCVRAPRRQSRVSDQVRNNLFVTHEGGHIPKKTNGYSTQCHWCASSVSSIKTLQLAKNAREEWGGNV